MPALGIWKSKEFPLAPDVAPAVYRQLGHIANRGKAAEVEGQKRDAVFALEVSTELPVSQPQRAGKCTPRELAHSPKVSMKTRRTLVACDENSCLNQFESAGSVAS
jgi:hypothetical protein